MLRTLDTSGWIEARAVIMQNMQQYRGDPTPHAESPRAWCSPIKNPSLIGTWQQIARGNHITEIRTSDAGRGALSKARRSRAAAAFPTVEDRLLGCFFALRSLVPTVRMYAETIDDGIHDPIEYEACIVDAIEYADLLIAAIGDVSVPNDGVPRIADDEDRARVRATLAMFLEVLRSLHSLQSEIIRGDDPNALPIRKVAATLRDFEGKAAEYDLLLRRVLAPTIDAEAESAPTRTPGPRPARDGETPRVLTIRAVLREIWGQIELGEFEPPPSRRALFDELNSRLRQRNEEGIRWDVLTRAIEGDPDLRAQWPKRRRSVTAVSGEGHEGKNGWLDSVSTTGR